MNRSTLKCGIFCLLALAVLGVCDAARCQTTTAPQKMTIQQIIQQLPRRVAAKNGTPGDMVNLLLIGSKDQVVKSLTDAGWTQPDKDTQTTVNTIIQDVMQHKAYDSMPMSMLYLFGRSQDFSWMQGMPLATVVTRNHFRLWQTPYLTPDGQTVWAGAGTHDMGIEKDGAGQYTHSIDPKVDGERDFVLQSLTDANHVKEQSYVLPSNPLQKALTATGDAFQSDGRISVIYLK